LPRNHTSTPGRIVSSAQGLWVFGLILCGMWKDALESTLLYFFIDMVFLIKYTTTEDSVKLKTITIFIHHILGFFLCSFSALIGSYDESHLGSKLTRALLFLEICNPLLHASMMMKYEYSFPYLKIPVDIAMLINYAYVRVWSLGKALIITDNDKQLLEFYSAFPTSLFFLLAIILWCLQILWFNYLLYTFFGSLCKKLD
jgi:hypothetical protein